MEVNDPSSAKNRSHTWPDNEGEVIKDISREGKAQGKLATLGLHLFEANTLCVPRFGWHTPTRKQRPSSMVSTKCYER